MLDEQWNLEGTHLFREFNPHWGHSGGQKMLQYFTAKHEQAITSTLVNKSGFLLSVLILSLVQSFLNVFADNCISDICTLFQIPAHLPLPCFLAALPQIYSNSLCSSQQEDS